MNITVIYSNKKRKKSSTYRIAHMIIRQLLEDGKLYEFYLPKDMPHVCNACGQCFLGHAERCGGYPYMKAIQDAFADSDLLIFCAPVYVFHAPGQMKTLLDHFAYRWLVHQFDEKMMKKQALIITTAAGGGLRSTVKDIKDSLEFLGTGKIYSIKQPVWGVSWQEAPLLLRKQAVRKANKMVKKIKADRKRIAPSLKVKFLYTIFRSFHTNKHMFEADDEYWERMGYTKGKAPWKRESV